jgi:hypothetical protein
MPVGGGVVGGGVVGGGLVGGGLVGGGVVVGGGDVVGGDDVGGADDGGLVGYCVAHAVVAAARCCTAWTGSSPIMFAKSSGVGVAVSLGPGAGDGLMSVDGEVLVGLGLGLLLAGVPVRHWVGDGSIVIIECCVWEVVGSPVLEFCWVDALDEFPLAVPEFWPVWLPPCNADVDTGWVSRGSMTVAAMATMARAPTAASVGRTQDDSRLKRGLRLPSGGSGAAPDEPPLPNEVRPVAATRNEVKIRCGKSCV